MTRFCHDYWPPLYAFLRRRGYPSADAQDLTQAFFASLLEHKSLGRATREKGRLRTYLLGSLQHFLANEYDRIQTLKRGGGKQIVSLDDHLVEAEAAVSVGNDSDSNSSYDQAWAVTLARRAWERLHATFVEEGKAELLMELKPLVAGGGATLPTRAKWHHGWACRFPRCAPTCSVCASDTVMRCARKSPARCPTREKSTRNCATSTDC